MTKNNHLTLLLYHGVCNKQKKGVANSSGKHIDVDEFHSQMKIIKNNYSVHSIDDIVTFHNKGETWPNNSVVITFDDGFKNNFEIAAPILDDLKLPAVFYVCSGMIGTDKMFWVDMIEDCINRTNANNIKIRLIEEHFFNLNSESEKILSINKIKNFCKKSTTNEKNRIIAELINETKVSPTINSYNNYQMMDWKELIALDQNKLFTIGGHTLNHEVMTAQSLEITKLDVKKTINLLKNYLDHDIIHFSYPEGQVNHFNKNIIKVLKNNGIVCSPSAIDGVNEFPTNLFQLKRIMPGFMGKPFPL